MDIVEYFDRYYTEGIIDLSSSSADDDGLPRTAARPAEAPFVPPSGGPELRERVAKQFSTAAPGDVLLAAGASEALVAVANAFVRPGDLVAADRGTYPSFTHAAELRGATVRYSARPRLVAGATIAAICNPTVPDGRLQRLGEPAVMTVVDESHIDLVHSDVLPARAADISENYLSVGGLSKGFGLGGLRIGWVVCRGRCAIDAIDRELQLLSGGPAAPSVDLAARVLDDGCGRLGTTMRAVEDNMPRLERTLRAAGWTYRLPDAGLTMSIRPGRRVTRTAERAAREAGYFIVPGRVYSEPGTYRLGLLAPVEHVRKALRILAGH
jgi:aspartate/methionine/tyrosine aminotransferase